MIRCAILLIALTTALPAAATDNWFETFKASASDADLYRLLHAMPKGGDLHNHNSGSSYSQWWYEIAIAQAARGYRYYTKVSINNCRDYAQIDRAYLLLFRNILDTEFQALSECEQSEYLPLEALDGAAKTGWLNSLRLDQPSEGREEFFESHWQRLNALLLNPHIRAETLYRNLQSLAEEGAIYLEAQVAVRGALRADGTPLTADEMIEVFRDRLRRPDAVATGMTVRLQLALLRFTPFAEADLRALYKIADDNSDIVAAINMVGREDNDKGHPARFLSTLRELRRTANVPLAIHAGEVDEPNSHVRDTLLLGAQRIGHGLNLITDDQTMLSMRNGPYLVEINLISNLLLGYVVDYSLHPFPEYLRFGIPVALSTDDRGMWDSTLTDEFFVAVKSFDLSWDEIKQLSRNSLQYSFTDDATKADLLKRYNQKIQRFERRMARTGLAKSDRLPDTRTFICARYKLCK